MPVSSDNDYRHYLTKKPDMKVSQELLAISKMITHWVMAIKSSIVIGIVLLQGHLFKNPEGDPFATRKVRQKRLLGE